jgi:hypothetical protein
MSAHDQPQEGAACVAEADAAGEAVAEDAATTLGTPGEWCCDGDAPAPLKDPLRLPNPARPGPRTGVPLPPAPARERERARMDAGGGLHSAPAQSSPSVADASAVAAEAAAAEAAAASRIACHSRDISCTHDLAYQLK